MNQMTAAIQNVAAQEAQRFGFKSPVDNRVAVTILVEPAELERAITNRVVEAEPNPDNNYVTEYYVDFDLPSIGGYEVEELSEQAIREMERRLVEADA